MHYGVMLKMNNNHPTLGAIKQSDSVSSSVEAICKFRNRELLVSIEPDDQTLSDSIDFAATVVNSLSSLEQLAKKILVRDLCSKYNDGWNEYEEAQKDGSYKSVKKPSLSEDEFEANFKLKSLSICGVECIEFWYDDSNLFWGHGVSVNALDGLDLSGAKADLFG